MSRFDAMQHFIRVADLGSFAAAADQLGVARSVVTRRIAALEEHLGVKLITRTTRKLTLTSAGGVYLERCRRILQAIDDAESEVMASSQTPRGQVHMGVPVRFYGRNPPPPRPCAEFLPTQLWRALHCPAAGAVSPSLPAHGADAGLQRPHQRFDR